MPPIAVQSLSRAWSWAAPLAVTVLFYGLAGGIWKRAALSVPQFCVLFVAAKAVTNLGAWALLSRRSLFQREARSFVLWCALGQVLNGFAWICYFIALGAGPVAIVQTITAAYTAFGAVLALVFLRERLMILQGAGILLVITAAMLIGYSTGDTQGTTAGSRGGGEVGWFVASLLTIAFWGAAVVIFKRAYAAPGADDLRFFLVNFVGMAVTVLPYGLFGLYGAGADASWSSEGLVLGAVIVLLYALGDFGLFVAIRRGPASIVSPLSGLYPIPTIAYAALVLDEPILPLQWLSLTMVLVGILAILPKDENPIRHLFGGRGG